MARQRTRGKVHQGVLSLTAEGDIAGITMEGIAARAGVSKQTLYRTWSSTGAILFDALLARSQDEAGDVVVQDSGDLAADLTALAAATITELTDPVQEPLLRAVTAELQSDRGLADQFRELLLEPQLRGIADRLRRAGVPDPDAVAELFVGPIFHRWLLRRNDFTQAWATAHVNHIVRAAFP